MICAEQTNASGEVEKFLFNNLYKVLKSNKNNILLF